MVPSATIIMSEATVFIGICTAASSDMFSGFLFINYFGNALFIHSNAFLNGQETIFQTHFTIDLITLIIFFLLHLVKEIISVFCSPLLCIFYVPVVSLYLPIRHLVFHRKRWYVPNKSVVRLCCVVAII